MGRVGPAQTAANGKRRVANELGQKVECDKQETYIGAAVGVGKQRTSRRSSSVSSSSSSAMKSGGSWSG